MTDASTDEVLHSVALKTILATFAMDHDNKKSADLMDAINGYQSGYISVKINDVQEYGVVDPLNKQFMHESAALIRKLASPYAAKEIIRLAENDADDFIRQALKQKNSVVTSAHSR